MPTLAKITYTEHAQERMDERRICPEDVEFTLRNGVGSPGRNGSWIYASGRYRIVVADVGATARVLTVVRLRGSS
jgi:hypothetical protein